MIKLEKVQYIRETFEILKVHAEARMQHYETGLRYSPDDFMRGYLEGRLKTLEHVCEIMESLVRGLTYDPTTKPEGELENEGKNN